MTHGVTLGYYHYFPASPTVLTISYKVCSNDDMQKERLEKIIAQRGLASRREAKALIGEGKVTVNGKVVTEPGFGIDPDTAHIELKDITTKESYLLYKPRGIETSKTSRNSKDIHDVFPKLAHLSPIGRLDKDSEGLIILSNDGTLTKALTQEHFSVGKTYRVTVKEFVSDAALQKMSHGIVLDKVKTKPAVTKRVSRMVFDITLHEGRKHQIRRMCDACKLTIESLVRIGIGHLKSTGMKAGNVKKLSPQDIADLKA